MDSELYTLVAACRKGSRKAQEKLYSELYAFTARIAMRYINTEADLADVLSQAFFKVFRNIHQFDEQKGNIYGWVKKIVINTALDYLKKKQLTDHTIEHTTNNDVVVQNEAIQKLNVNSILVEIRKLPPATHAVFVMYVVDGYSHKEIAAQLQISEGTSKWHLSEARNFLKNRLSLLKLVE